MAFAGAQAQEQENERRPAPRNAVTSMRTLEPSDLAKENMGRVAASSAQLQTVLLKDAGILVELKSWVAKEATNDGQVVEDSLLTDQAIFDARPRCGLPVRGHAPGAALWLPAPSVNPDSEIGSNRSWSCENAPAVWRRAKIRRMARVRAARRQQESITTAADG
jgi:hypothetical protein